MTLPFVEKQGQRTHTCTCFENRNVLLTAPSMRNTGPPRDPKISLIHTRYKWNC